MTQREITELEHELAYALRSNDELRLKLAAVTERYNIDTWEMSLLRDERLKMKQQIERMEKESK